MIEIIISTLEKKVFIFRWSTGMYLTVSIFCISIFGCGVLPQKPAINRVETVKTKPKEDPAKSNTVTKVILKADTKRIEQLEREIARLQAELARAEDTLVAVESGLQSGYTRADAVSSMVEAQIQLEKTAARSPWHVDMINKAQDKLKSAQSHIDAGRFGAGLFFVYRVNSIVNVINDETKVIRTSPSLLFVSKKRANLRDGPSTNYKVITTLTQDTPLFREDRSEGWVLVRTHSGMVGWIHAGLLTRKVPEGTDGLSGAK